MAKEASSGGVQWEEWTEDWVILMLVSKLSNENKV